MIFPEHFFLLIGTSMMRLHGIEEKKKFKKKKQTTINSASHRDGDREFNIVQHVLLDM